MEVETTPDCKHYEVACGIDFGSSELVASIATSAEPHKASLVRNNLSHDTTPCIISIYRNERNIGENAISKATLCPGNVYSHMNLVLYYNNSIGELKDKYADLAFTIKDGSDSNIMFSVSDDDLLTEVSATHVVSMLLKSLYTLVEKENPESVKRAVISLPPNMPTSSIQIVKKAAHLAGFVDVDIARTDLAQAFSYGLKLKSLGDLPADQPRHVLFVDQGSCFTNLYVVKFTITGCELLHSVNHQIGAKDVDRLLYDYYVTEIRKKVVIEPHSKRAVRLMNACCKLKEMLSSAPQTCFTASGILDDDDLQMMMSRSKLEEICRSQVTAMESMASQFRSEYTGPIDCVEMIGGGCRIPFIKRIIETVFSLPLSFTVDSASCIGKGCALLGLYPDVCGVYAVMGERLLEGGEEGVVDEAMRELEMKLCERDAKQQELANARNDLEALIGTSRHAAYGPFKDTLDEDQLNQILNAEDDWLMNEGDNCDALTLRSHLDNLDAKLHSTFSKYYEAVEADHKRIEAELEEERKNRGDEIKDDDIKLPYNARLSRVEVNKKEGNDLFKDQNFVVASQRYMRALSHCRKFYDLSEEKKLIVSELELSLHLNLAQCFIKMEQWAKAIDHCNDAMKIKENHPKALYRRALCYDKQQDVEKCSADLKVVLKLTPDDQSVKYLVAKNERDKQILLKKKKMMAQRMFGGDN